MELVYSLNNRAWVAEWAQDETHKQWITSTSQKRIQMYKLSMQIARRYHKVVLYTDDIGEEILGDYADEVIRLNLDSDNYLWSEAKLEAIDRHHLDCIHIDGDLFLSGELNIIPADVLYEHNEIRGGDHQYKKHIEVFNQYNIKDVFEEWQDTFKGSCNIGLLKFNHIVHKKYYIHTFKKLKKWYFNTVPEHVRDTLIDISITLEQYSLKCLCDYHGWTSEELYKHNDYLHMYGAQKFTKPFTFMVDSALKHV